VLQHQVVKAHHDALAMSKGHRLPGLCRTACLLEGNINVNGLGLWQGGDEGPIERGEVFLCSRSGEHEVGPGTLLLARDRRMHGR
jgi:hypothetical protein